MKALVLSSVFALTVAATAAQAAPTAKKSVRVVSSAKALNVAEKASVTGMHCGCPEPVVLDQKPGYGFGTTGHYGPPGQGFTSTDSWRMSVNGGSGLTPTLNQLPPRAFTTPTR